MKKKLNPDLRKENQLRFQSEILMNMGEGVQLTRHSDGIIVYTNQCFESMFGYQKNELIGKHVSILNALGDKGPEETAAEIIKSLEQSGVWNGVIRNRKKDGTIFWSSVKISAFRYFDHGDVWISVHEDITDKIQSELKLKESEKKYQKLSRHLEELIEKERSEIALNLHDDLGQRLTALNLDLAWIKSRIGVQSPEVRKKLKEMDSFINDTIDSIKEFSSILRPDALFDLGLIPAIMMLLEKYEKQSGIKCHFQSGDIEMKIENRSSMIIYRIIQESLTNIIRHSGASNAFVSIGILKKRFEMTIKDDGKGIDEEKVDSIGSMGITGIKERVFSLQGKVNIKGVKNKGTMIEVSIPINKITANDQSSDYR